MSINITVTGRLTKAPELRLGRHPAKLVARFDLAQDFRETSNAELGLTKGSPVSVDGLWSKRSWTTEEGERRINDVLTVSEVRLFTETEISCPTALRTTANPRWTKPARAGRLTALLCGSVRPGPQGSRPRGIAPGRALRRGTCPGFRRPWRTGPGLHKPPPTRPAAGGYLLSAHIVVQSGATLNLAESGGLRLRLACDTDGFVSIVNCGGTLNIKGTNGRPVTISSQNRETDDADLLTNDGGRTCARSAIMCAETRPADRPRLLERPYRRPGADRHRPPALIVHRDGEDDDQAGTNKPGILHPTVRSAASERGRGTCSTPTNSHPTRGDIQRWPKHSIPPTPRRTVPPEGRQRYGRAGRVIASGGV